MVNLEWYRSFVEVYRMGTASGAAEVLHLTQPAVSQHIAALESALGAELFQRKPRRMVPTATGKRLYSQVVMAIETLEAVPTKSSLGHQPQLVRLGAPAEFFSEYVVQQLPKTEDMLLSVRFGLAQELIDLLLMGQVDGVISTQKIDRPELNYQPMFEENFWLVGPPHINHPIPDNLTHLEPWLKAQQWITYGEDLPIIRRFWRIIFDKRLAVNPQLVIPDLRSIRAAVSAGLGLSVLPDYLCHSWLNEGRLSLLLRPEKVVTNQIWLVYRKKERKSVAISTLLSYLGLVKN